MLKINDKYSIGTDALNVILFEHKVSEGKGKRPGREGVAGQDYQTAIGYFSSFKAALNFLVEHEIKGAGLEDYKSVVAKIEELHKSIDQLPIPNRF